MRIFALTYQNSMTCTEDFACIKNVGNKVLKYSFSYETPLGKEGD